MSVRAIIILLALPLFLLLAGVNSFLLYDEETRHMESGLRGEALAAAVTVAEFARQSADPFADLGQPTRVAALRDASRKLQGLEALYLLRPGKLLLNIDGQPPVLHERLKLPDRAEVISGWENARGEPLVVALAPDGHGAMAVAVISAEPLERRAFHLKRLLIVLIAGSAGLAVLLGLILGRRVGREFSRTRAVIDAGGDVGTMAGRGIREVRELANAVGLLDKSVASELECLARRPDGGLEDGLLALRRRHLPDIDALSDGTAIAVRFHPEAPAGSIAVVQPGPDGWNIALGVADGEPAAALAAAIAARDHILAGPAPAFRDRLDLTAQAFAIDWRVTATAVQDSAFGLTGDPTAFSAYAARNPDLSAEALAGDLAILFAESGIVAAVRPA